MSFPLPNVEGDIMRYDEAALRQFEGDKFFLIAVYKTDLPKTGKYIKWSVAPDEMTGSSGFHEYLEEEWMIKDSLLVETGRGGPNSRTYLIYLERKLRNKRNSNNSNSSNSNSNNSNSNSNSSNSNSNNSNSSNSNSNNSNSSNSNLEGEASRKCPKHNAKDYKLKTVKKGLDGKMWIVSKRSNGIKFWKRK